MSKKDGVSVPMSYKRAGHLLNPLRKLILSPSKLAKRLLLKPNANVLELGCGPGYYSTEVAEKIKNGKLTLVDIQQEMLDLAKTRIDSLGISNVNYVRSDATALPFENNSFDVVYLVAMLGEVPDQGGCIRELHRILQPNGLLSVSEQPFDPDFITIPKLKELVGVTFRFEKAFGNSHNYTANFRK